MNAFVRPPFKNQRLWQQAMTHSSFANEQPEAGEHNERLEFLGDAILTFVSGAYLYQRYPERPEGDLTPLRAALVDEAQLCHFAQQLGLGESLRLGKGAAQSGSRKSSRLLCSAFEAMVGAYFLDAGGDVQAVSDYVVPMFDTVVEQAVRAGVNPKSRLQEWAQKAWGQTPDYVLISSSGPDHAKQFVVEVQIGQRPYGRGWGHSKKTAEKAAAQSALSAIDTGL
ncbi:MAG: ribonuclease III [Phormidesmis sp. RL_2_1]|nr:ribonuclease III [Phormidesmis sp. RL_2_1]